MENVGKALEIGWHLPHFCFGGDVRGRVLREPAHGDEVPPIGFP